MWNTHPLSGPALNAAKRVIQHLGGKLCLFQASLPTIGEGALKMRENPRLLGSDKEHTMLNAEDMYAPLVLPCSLSFLVPPCSSLYCTSSSPLFIVYIKCCLFITPASAVCCVCCFFINHVAYGVVIITVNLLFLCMCICV
jgi:hypothetical protein